MYSRYLCDETDVLLLRRWINNFFCFQTDYVPAGPFVTAQTALFVPVSMLESALSWMVQHRGKLDVFIHPNSGCMIQDHIVHGIWAGNKWEVDPSIFLD